MNLLVTTAARRGCGCPPGQLVVPATLAEASTTLDSLCCSRCGTPLDWAGVIGSGLFALDMLLLTQDQIGSAAWSSVPLPARVEIVEGMLGQWQSFLALVSRLRPGSVVSLLDLPETYGPDYRVMMR